mmetsp:Transcript_16483/g.62683  ORF Transcript_16483/g.62683 Transcript_16483/m.62683 type:complete len:210 (-) Transcript_16483:1448-2077(-)
MLRRREADQMSLQLSVRDGGLLLDFLERQHVCFVEHHEDAHLIRADIQVVTFHLAVGPEDGLEVRSAHVHLPVHLPPSVILEVVSLEDLAKLGDLRRQAAWLAQRVRPVPLCKDAAVEVQRRSFLVGLPHVRRAELLQGVPRDLHVVEHALQLRSELVTAFRLQLDDHRFLRFVAQALAAEQPLAQILLVELLKDVFVLQVSEQDDHSI